LRKLIFIGGVHGVGKTFFCDQIAKEINLITCSASKIIADKRKQEFSNNKRISHIKENQDILLEAIEDLSLEENVLLLDGHFCLVNKENKIEPIPQDTFSKLSPRGIIVLTDAPINIYSRLSMRNKGVVFDSEFIEKLQNEEVSYSKKISKSLEVPLFFQHIAEDINEA
jgi:adenylate kinase